MRRAGRVEPAAPAPDQTWLYEPFPAPDFSHQDVNGETRSLAALGGRPARPPALVDDAGGSRAAFDALARGSGALAQAGVGALAIALDPPADLPRVRAASAASLPVILAGPGAGPELRDPQPSPVHEPAGPASPDNVPSRCSREGRQGLPRRRRRRAHRGATRRAIDGVSGRASRSSRAVPGHVLLVRCRPATTCPTGGSCSIRGWTPPRSSPSSVPRRRTRAPPRCIGWARSWRRAAKPDARAPRSSARWRCSPTSPRRATTSARCSRRAATSRRPSDASAPRSPRRPSTPMRSTTSATRCC